MGFTLNLSEEQAINLGINVWPAGSMQDYLTKGHVPERRHEDFSQMANSRAKHRVKEPQIHAAKLLKSETLSRS